MTLITRRAFTLGLLAAPAIIPVSRLMSVVPYQQETYIYSLETVRFIETAAPSIGELFYDENSDGGFYMFNGRDFVPIGDHPKTPPVPPRIFSRIEVGGCRWDVSNRAPSPRPRLHPVHPGDGTAPADVSRNIRRA